MDFLDLERNYKLVGRKVVPCNFHEWMRWFSTFAHKRHIGYTRDGSRTVSTIFLGVNMRPFATDGSPPVVFETMAFDDSLGDDDRVLYEFQRRWATYDEAELGHYTTCLTLFGAKLTKKLLGDPPKPQGDAT